MANPDQQQNNTSDNAKELLSDLNKFFEKKEAVQDYLLENYADEETRKKIEAEREKRKQINEKIDLKTFTSLKDNLIKPRKATLTFVLDSKNVDLEIYVKKASTGQMIYFEKIRNLFNTDSFWKSSECNELKNELKELLCEDEQGTPLNNNAFDMIFNDLFLFMQIFQIINDNSISFKKN